MQEAEEIYSLDAWLLLKFGQPGTPTTVAAFVRGVPGPGSPSNLNDRYIQQRLRNSGPTTLAGVPLSIPGNT